MEISLDKAKNHTLNIVGHLVDNYLMKEVNGRIMSGAMKTTPLPILVNDFLVKLEKSDGQPKKVVQINNETTFKMEVDPGYDISHLPVGSNITIDNVDWERIHVSRLKRNGDVYFHTYVHYTLYNHFIFWDSILVPQEAQDGFSSEPIRFPIKKYLEKYNLPSLDYIDKIKVLTEANWPPVAGFYPYIFYSDLEGLKGAVNEPDTIEIIINQVYTEDRWANSIALWTLEEYFFGREIYVKIAVERFLAGDYISCIYVAAPQIEGIVRDHLRSLKSKSDDGFKMCVERMKNIILERNVIFYDKPVLDIIFEFIKEGGFWNNSATISEPGDQINRHGIVHGSFIGFENKTIAFKYLLLIDCLASIIEHERIMTNSFNYGIQVEMSSVISEYMT